MNCERNSTSRWKQLNHIKMQQTPENLSQSINCPENLSQPIFQIESKSKYSDSKNFQKISECHDKYATPLRKKRAVTRESLLENYWWHQFYEEYLREVYRGIDIPKIPNTEYIHHFGKDTPIQVNIDEIINKYPIYGSNAITWYNQVGDKRLNFRKKLNITRPVSEQFDTQFG